AIQPQDLRTPASRLQKAEQNPNGRRLTGSVVADQCHHRTRLRRQRELVQRRLLAEALRHVIPTKHGTHESVPFFARLPLADRSSRVSSSSTSARISFASSRLLRTSSSTCRMRSRSSVSRSFWQCETASAATARPVPRTASRIPSVVKSRYARKTVFGLTASSLASSRT